MEKRKLGRTDMEVSRLGCGGLFVAGFATQFEEAKAAVHCALAHGVNYVDTAPGYHNSEEVLGKCLEDAAQPYYLSTKLGGRPQPFDPKSKDGLRASIEESLRLLKRDHIDILYIHEPDRPGQYDWFDEWDTFHGPVCDVMDDLKSKGVIRYTGLGGTTAYEMARIIERADYDVVLTAFNYSMLWQEAAVAVIPAAKKKGMGIVAGSPLQQGWLAKRYDDVVKNNPPAWLAPQRREQFIRLYDLLDRGGLPVAEVALRWALSNQDIDTVLMGVRSPKEVELNVAAAKAGPLPDDVMAEIRDIAAMVPCRPFEEPFGCGLGTGRRGPGQAR